MEVVDVLGLTTLPMTSIGFFFEDVKVYRDYCISDEAKKITF